MYINIKLKKGWGLINKIFISGYIGKTPELRYSSNETAICKFSVAVSSGYGDNKKTNWLNCVAFQKSAEAISKYMYKGSPITIEGHIQTGSYEGRDGTKVYTTDIIIDNWEFAMRDKNQGEREIESQVSKKVDESEGIDDIPDDFDADESSLPF